MYQVYEVWRLPAPNTGGNRDLFSPQGSISDPTLLDFEGCLKTGCLEERRFCCSTDSSSRAILNVECPGKTKWEMNEISGSTELSLIKTFENHDPCLKKWKILSMRGHAVGRR